MTSFSTASILRFGEPPWPAYENGVGRSIRTPRWMPEQIPAGTEGRRIIFRLRRPVKPPDGRVQGRSRRAVPCPGEQDRRALADSRRRGADTGRTGTDGGRLGAGVPAPGTAFRGRPGVLRDGLRLRPLLR